MDKKTIYSRFKQEAEKYPEKTVIIEEGRSVNFKQLDLLADKILSKFRDDNHKFIGIVMHHGINQIAAMLAVLKSGAAYVPAEPALPKSRIDYMMDFAGVTLVIDDKFCEDIPDSAPDYKDSSLPEGIAYILFTSGTTGKPKGVVIENHSVVNYAEAFEHEMQIGPGDVMLQFSVCSFDIFVEEVFASILNGAALAIPNRQIHDGSLDVLMDFCKRHKVTILDGFPYLVADLNRRPELIPETVSLIISGGDVVRASYISNLKNRGMRIYNTYGPSETTVCATYYRIDNSEPLKDGTFPVGKAVKGVSVKILDNRLKEVAKGETGEICIMGEGVGRGYLGSPPEMANFIEYSEGKRLYRSGDLGYELPDGNIAFLHRRDDQVMILGRRVEPDEVENVLNEYPHIDRGIVRAFLDEGGLHYLVAYVVTDEGFSLTDLRAFLLSRLADFMVPEFVVAVPEIPVTYRGKVDMKKLPVVLKEGVYL